MHDGDRLPNPDSSAACCRSNELQGTVLQLRSLSTYRYVRNRRSHSKLEPRLPDRAVPKLPHEVGLQTAANLNGYSSLNLRTLVLPL